MHKANVVVVGATGAVGREVLKLLEERDFPVEELLPLASARSEGLQLTFKGKKVTVHEAKPESFNGVDIVFFAAGGGTSKKLAPEAAKRGAVVVDKSSAWRMDPNVPLVIPEINPGDILEHQGIISSPNCSTIVMLMALAPLHHANPIKRVIVDTYQSASGAGGKGIIELMQQARDVLEDKETTHSTFPHTLAFNVLPHIEEFTDDDYTTEEIKMQNETRKIMHLPDLPVSATCVRVPVLISHSEAVHIEFTHPFTPQEARQVLTEAPGVIVQDDVAHKVYPLAVDAAGKDEIFVGRIRKDMAIENGLSIWVVGDNLRKGAALNAIQIAEEVLKRDLHGSHERGASTVRTLNQRSGKRDEKAMFDADREWFAEHKDELLAQHGGQYVAILNGAVVDHDPGFEKLAERIYAKYGYRDFVMQKVKANTKPYRIDSPRLARP